MPDSKSTIYFLSLKAHFNTMFCVNVQQLLVHRGLISYLSFPCSKFTETDIDIFVVAMLGLYFILSETISLLLICIPFLLKPPFDRYILVSC